MTTPSGLEPPGSTPTGGMTWGDYAEKSEEDWKTEQTSTWEGAADPVSLFGSFIQDLPMLVLTSMLMMLADLLDMVPIVGSIMSEIVEQIAEGLNNTNFTAVAADTNATTAVNNLASSNLSVTNHENRITILESQDQIASYEANGTWNKPAGSWATHTVIAIGGGGGGRKAREYHAQAGGYGGGRGGFDEDSLLDASMPSSVSVTIGAGGAGSTVHNTNGSAGSATTLGTTVGGGGAAGGTAEPTLATGNRSDYNSKGGHGRGNDNGPTDSASASGGNGLLCIGGDGGATSSNSAGGAGGNGVDCPPGSMGPGSGGGGGGRGGTGGGRGGDGGYPGGGGGGSGTWDSVWNNSGNGRGGNGANGKGWIISVHT